MGVLGHFGQDSEPGLGDSQTGRSQMIVGAFHAIHHNLESVKFTLSYDHA